MLLPRVSARAWARRPTYHRLLEGPVHTTGRFARQCYARRATSMVTCFKGTSVQELNEWLERHGVDISQYGRGTSKTVAELLEEATNQESVLDIHEGKALRIVKVLTLHITNPQGKVLYEDEQILPDGRSRRRGVTVSEKLVSSENWKQAVPRAIREELGTVLPSGYQSGDSPCKPRSLVEAQFSVTLFEDTYRTATEYSNSMSYPGLLTKYIFHRVNAKVPQLPEGPFETFEPRPGGNLVTKWVWREAPAMDPMGSTE